MDSEPRSRQAQLFKRLKHSEPQCQRDQYPTISLALLYLSLITAILNTGCAAMDHAIHHLPTDEELASLRHSKSQRDRTDPKPQLSSTSTPPSPESAPTLFPSDVMAKLEVTMNNGDPADIYYPNLKQPTTQTLRFPIALFLQGLNVDKAHYSRYAQQVARYGFIVVIPNHRTSIRGRDELFAQVGQVPDTLELARTLTADRTSPLFDRIDASQLVLLGHSHGGMMGLDAVRGACDVPFCIGEYSLPDELKAAVFFGTSLWENGEYLSINNTSIPVALIAGDRDSLIAIEETRQTYAHIISPPRALITLAGVNHYGLTNVNNPPGSPSEVNPPQVDQTASIDAIARWSGLFLRAHTWDDPHARNAIYRFTPDTHTTDSIPTTIDSQPRKSLESRSSRRWIE
jgi:dienelactone hydrolase